MAIVVLAADVGFINFDLTHQSIERLIFHRGSDAMAHEPSGTIFAASNLAMDLKRTDTLLRLAHQVGDLKPCYERILGVLEDRARCH